MTERERVCILCGKKEEMLGYMCPACQDRIQREVMGKRREMRQEAERVLRRNGVVPAGDKKQ
ncbi:MAG TPA: hypothetical protein VM658_16200 [bacterium]|nr:hypothetical protein [bacterium]